MTVGGEFDCADQSALGRSHPRGKPAREMINGKTKENLDEENVSTE